MKKWILSFTIFCLCSSVAVAQTGTKKGAAKRQSSAPRKAKLAVADTSFMLMSTGSNNALRETATSRYTIADPTIRTFNTRAFTNVVPDDEKAIIGIPKIRTGIAHGRILFYPTTSATSGANTGSGTVGTGSSLGIVGTSGAGLGVNGKNPYAGPSIYGTPIVSDIQRPSASSRPVNYKQR